tara:strand:+ start:1468 stop:1917 length:450 start_codon:yes stop_codon:yes gene_type:complete
MNKNIFIGIIITIILAVAFFVKPVDATDHEWYPDDVAFVTHVCSVADPLVASATLYKDPTPENLALADSMFLKSMQVKTCVYNEKSFIVKLVKKVTTIQNLYNIDGYDGQVWESTTVGQNGLVYRVYVGMLKKEFAAKRDMNFKPGVNL